MKRILSAVLGSLLTLNLASAATNDFQPFAYGAGANVISQSTYATNTTLLQNGFTSGTAYSNQLNKVWRQSSIMAAVLGNFIVNQTGQNVVDDGTTATINANLLAAIQSVTVTNANNLNRPGWIFDFGGTTCPSGTLTVGTTAATVSRTTYAALFAAIGTTWGAGDGSTTFNLPVILADQVTVQASSNVGTSTVGAVIAHTHNLSMTIGQNTVGAAGGGTLIISPGYGPITVLSTGGSYNLAAGVRVLKCIQY